jgi:SAM-dependent methyltransferase
LIDYPGAELAAMGRASNYYRWIVRHCRPYLRGTVLEFGAGTGNFSEHLLHEAIDKLILVEPAAGLVDVLRSRLPSDPRVEVCPGILQDFGDRLEGRLDVVLSVNVLEHIEDDVAVLRTASRTLRPPGHLLLFVPAFPLLYGSLDVAFGHVRRYTKPTLTRTLGAAGFSPLTLRYMNVLGVLPWLLTGRVLRRTTLNPGVVALADRTMIPLTAALERLFTTPIGQGLFAVARKTLQ